MIQVAECSSKASFKAHFYYLLQVSFFIKCNLYNYFCSSIGSLELIAPCHAWKLIGGITIFITKAVYSLEALVGCNISEINSCPHSRVIRANHCIEPMTSLFKLH